jgi:hypothetical protein
MVPCQFADGNQDQEHSYGVYVRSAILLIRRNLKTTPSIAKP